MSHVKKGDTVVVLSGKDRGKSGEVLRVMPKDSEAIVKGINVITRHLKPSMNNPQGGRIQKEAPIDTSKLMVQCPSCQKPTRLAHIRTMEGRGVRVCKKCQEQLDK